MKSNKINEFCAKSGIGVIIKYKYLFLLLIAIVTIFGYFGTDRIVMDSSNESSSSSCRSG